MNSNLTTDPLRAETLALLERSAARFSDLVQSLTEVEWQAPPREGEWSLAQVAEHLGLVEVGSGKLIARKLFLEPASEELLTKADGKEALLRQALPDRANRRIEAPDFVRPVGTWQSRDELLSAFWHWRGSTIALLSDPAREPRRFVAHHPALGMLDGLCWGLFLALHVERHIEQMAEIRNRRPA